MMETPLRSVPEPVEGQLDSLDENRSFERFFDAERTRLFGALAVMSGNRAEAEEVMQDAFLKVWERWGRVSAMESPEGFLYRTALNLYRKRLRRAAIAVRKATTLLPEDDALGGVETRDEVARLLRGLTQREREAIVVTAYLGYSKRRPASCWGSGEHRARAHVEGSRHSPTTGHGGTNVIDEREIVRVAVERLAPPEPSYERLVRRRDRKRRNQRSGCRRDRGLRGGGLDRRPLGRSIAPRHRPFQDRRRPDRRRPTICSIWTPA